MECTGSPDRISSPSGALFAWSCEGSALLTVNCARNTSSHSSTILCTGVRFDPSRSQRAFIAAFARMDSLAGPSPINYFSRLFSYM